MWSDKKRKENHEGPVGKRWMEGMKKEEKRMKGCNKSTEIYEFVWMCTQTSLRKQWSVSCLTISGMSLNDTNGVKETETISTNILNTSWKQLPFWEQRTALSDYTHLWFVLFCVKESEREADGSHLDGDMVCVRTTNMWQTHYFLSSEPVNTPRKKCLNAELQSDHAF